MFQQILLKYSRKHFKYFLVYARISMRYCFNEIIIFSLYYYHLKKDNENTIVRLTLTDSICNELPR